MKNIFYFNTFINESNDQEWSKNENIIEEIKETFLELIDDEFSVNIKKYYKPLDKWKKYNTIHISIKKVDFAGFSLSFFTINDIKDILETSISYLNEVYNLKIYKIAYTQLNRDTIVDDLNDIDYNEEILNLEIFLK